MNENQFSLTEGKLRRIIEGVLKNPVLKENFRPIDSPADYIRQNNIQMRSASKFARINAVQAQGGEQVHTIASDGTDETINTANAGDWIVNNVSNPDNKWIIDAATFAKKYQPDPAQEGVYMPKGGPMMAGQISEPISFNAPWGERMNIDKGGYLMQTPGSETDIYGISGPDFDSTYRFNDPVNEGEIRLTKEGMRNYVENIVRESLEEISYRTASQAYDKAEKMNGGWGSGTHGSFVRDDVEKLKDAFVNLQNDFRDFSLNDNVVEAMRDIDYAIDTLIDFADRKANQRDNFEDFRDTKEKEVMVTFYSKLLGRQVAAQEIPYNWYECPVEKEAQQVYDNMTDEERNSFEQSLTPDEKYFYENKW